MPKGYKELIHEFFGKKKELIHLTYPHQSTCRIAKSPRATTLEIAFTHLKSGSFHNGGQKKPPWWSISPLYSPPTRVEDLCLPLRHANFYYKAWEIISNIHFWIANQHRFHFNRNFFIWTYHRKLSNSFSSLLCHNTLFIIDILFLCRNFTNYMVDTDIIELDISLSYLSTMQ